MIKKLTAIIMMAVLVCSLAACGGQTNKNDGNENETTTSGTQNEGKNKYKNITAETSPIGVDNISVKMAEDSGGSFPFVFCTIHKNGGDIEESVVEVTIEVLDENNVYIGEETLKTERSLTEGDSETVKTYLHKCTDEKRTDEYLGKCKLNVVAIKETDVAEAKEAEALEELMSEIEWKITYDKEYNSAITMLKIAKEQYPDSKELKLISNKKAQKKPPGNKGVLPLYRAACYAVTNFLFGNLYLVLFCFSLFDFGLCDNYFLILFNPFDLCAQVFGNKPCRKHCAVFFDFRSNIS